MDCIWCPRPASKYNIPLLWLAALLRGLFVHPIIGHLSDRTWHLCWGRRPCVLLGAVLSFLALFFVPFISMVSAILLSQWPSRRGLNRHWIHLVSLVLAGLLNLAIREGGMQRSV